MLLHVLGHVELNQGVLFAKQELGQSLGRLGFPDTGGPEEDERPRRAARVLQPGPRPPYRLGDGGNGVMLTDNPLVKLALHMD